MPDLIQLEMFVLTYELGSLAAVARKLDVSSAAISKQLTKLEKELSLQLIIRSTRKLEFTSIGINYYQQCKRIFEEVESAAALISHAKSVPQGRLKVVSARHFGITHIVPYVKEFLTKYPLIELDLELAERIPDLNVEMIDVLIGMSISSADNTIQKKILTTSYVFCASPAYLKKFGIPQKPQDLKKHQYITHIMRQPDDELIFKNNEVITVKPYLRVNDSQTMLSFALCDLGIVKLHRYVVKDYLEKGLLQEVLLSYTHFEIPIYVAYPLRRFISTKTRIFIDFISTKNNF